MAVGGTLEAVRQVTAGSLSHAAGLARPPGHHAERNRAMGYCIFNNVAIGSMAARTALGLARVMVVDWDLHHGNGTQHIFERDPSVFFFSSHQFPHYPGTGHLTETGLGPGEGTTMNVPLIRGCGDGEFAALYQGLLPLVARAFKPELILVSAGFDIHADDPLGGMKVTPAGFAGLDPAASGRCPSDLCRAGGVLPGGRIPCRCPGRFGHVHDRRTHRADNDRRGCHGRQRRSRSTESHRGPLRPHPPTVLESAGRTAVATSTALTYREHLANR
jgi:acetoin utilization deacetylase AcuC-like enzyme